ncbi:hypothetical protein EHQ68_09025 [Leptospira congkakensis]|uniref:Uncharacterized protein n=1 Tax=Leptospira congkakensis TaxID=2484932 RepID=A0A4Z1AJM6_9LEPT|nr:hypothetical protein [Leptospira congkakensis]TGL88768.1 hypothetical protein EHQ69_15095 [Leptospira congkakensis]TGL89354.1 hypothetical protein EHQ68_09025 [Leptospira congkakensis]TGL97322.1 hypothetical protein EHQ70_08520 [Leptospira congkakensis]
MRSFYSSIVLFVLLQTVSCNQPSAKNDLSPVLLFFGTLGNEQTSPLEDKFQSIQVTTFYRKDGTFQFQDILIEYKLKSPKENSETVEAFFGNPNEISYNVSTNKISGQISQKEDLFQTNSIVFSNSDFTKRFKVFLTLKKEGKIISLKEVTTTPPNPPSIPPNSVTLPQISYENNRSLIGGTEYQVIRVKFEAGSDLSNFTRLNAYIGRPSVIAMAPDNFNVVNYISVASYNDSLNYFLFLTPELNASYKIIVVASNDNAKGHRIIDTVPPPPPPSPCAGSVNAPATIGNCSTHCLMVDLIGNQMQFTAKTNIVSTTEEYLSLDTTSTTPSGGVGPTNWSWVEFFSPIAAGEYETEIRSFDVTTYNQSCVVLSSFLVLDGPDGFRDSYLSGKINVP